MNAFLNTFVYTAFFLALIATLAIVWSLFTFPVYGMFAMYLPVVTGILDLPVIGTMTEIVIWIVKVELLILFSKAVVAVYNALVTGNVELPHN